MGVWGYAMTQYFLNMLFALDQFLSTILGGHPDDTISQRLGRAHMAGVKAAEPFRVTLDWLVLILFGEDNHCLRSLSGRSSVKELWNWGGSRKYMDVED